MLHGVFEKWFSGTSQHYDLLPILWVFKQRPVLSLQSNGSAVYVWVKNIQYNVRNSCVSVIYILGKSFPIFIIQTGII